ncbi:Thiopurine S-methyltransferase [Fusarium sp. LHS14.1]|nr:Thiopurine S-methyltransferase [Fusarium sp. LHS14.1]
MSDPNTRHVRQRLLEHFEGDGSDANAKWCSLWDAGDFLPWDRGCPNPALVDLLEQKQNLLGESILIRDPHTGKTRRKRALVAGCGRGYDVLLLASFGFDAYGLEISPQAVQLCHEVGKEDYPDRSGDHGFGQARFIVGDFFQDDWLEQVDGGRSFELFYDYTFLCALNPSKRPAWSLRYSQLASQTNDTRLICVEFPTYKEYSSGGPPFGVPPPVYVGHLGQPGVQLPYTTEGIPATEGAPKSDAEGFERIAHWQPSVTHEAGKGTDWVSIWKLHRGGTSGGEEEESKCT